MLSRKLSSPIRQSAINALYNKKDVFLHSWTEACATTCALRILIQEEINEFSSSSRSSLINSDTTDDKDSSSSPSSSFNQLIDEIDINMKFRSDLRDALFRIHVPRTILPTETGDGTLWAPLKFSSQKLREEQEQKQKQQLPFTNEEFVEWIERTSNFPKSLQYGGELYVPLPCFVSSFESLAQLKKKDNNNNNNDYFAAQQQIHQHLHKLTSSETKPYKDLLDWFVSSGQKDRLDEEMAEIRGSLSSILSSQQTKLLFRSAITLAGSSDIQFLAKALLTKLHTGNVLLIDENEAALKQFGSVLRKAAREQHQLKPLTATARTFNATKRSDALFDISMNKNDSSASSTTPLLEYDPSKTQQEVQRGLRGSGGNSNNNRSSSATRSTHQAQSFPPVVYTHHDGSNIKKSLKLPPKLPFSLRPNETGGDNDDDIINGNNNSSSQQQDYAEVDFNLCMFQTPVEPLFSNVLKSTRDWYQIYRRELNSESEPRNIRVLKKLYETIDEKLSSLLENNNATNQSGEREQEEGEGFLLNPEEDLPPNQLLSTSRTKELLMDFDSQLFQRVSGDVGGFVIVVAPVFNNSSSSNSNSDFLLPRFSDGRVGKFPDLVYSRDYPMSDIWREQFEEAALKTRIRRRHLAFDESEIEKVLFDDEIVETAKVDREQEKAASKETDDDNEKSLLQNVKQFLFRDPFATEQTSRHQDGGISKEEENNNVRSLLPSSNFGTLTSSQMEAFLSLFDQFQTTTDEDEVSPAFSLRVAVYKCPPGLGGSLHENTATRQNPNPRLQDPQQQQKNLVGTKSLKETLRRRQSSNNDGNNSINHDDDKRPSEKRSDRSSAKYAVGGSLVEFTNTFEYDNYMPRSGPSVPHHWADDAPSFSYLDATHVGRRKAEIEKRNQGHEPHKFSDILFPAHSTRTHALINEESELAELDAEKEEYDESVGNNNNNKYDPRNDTAFTSLTVSEEEIAKMTPHQRNAFYSQYAKRQQQQESKSTNKQRTSSSSSFAAEKLREAQMRFGTVGAIFKGSQKRKQLIRTASKKELLRSLDRRMADEKFFEEKILPIGQTTLMVENELSKVKVKTAEQMANAKWHDRPKFFGSPEHRGVKLGWMAQRAKERKDSQRSGDGGGGNPRR